MLYRLMRLDVDHRFQVAAAEVDELKRQKDANECGRAAQGGARSAAAGFVQTEVFGFFPRANT